MPQLEFKNWFTKILSGLNTNLTHIFASTDLRNICQCPGHMISADPWRGTATLDIYFAISRLRTLSATSLEPEPIKKHTQAIKGSYNDRHECSIHILATGHPVYAHQGRQHYIKGITIQQNLIKPAPWPYKLLSLHAGTSTSTPDSWEPSSFGFAHHRLTDPQNLYDRIRSLDNASGVRTL